MRRSEWFRSERRITDTRPRRKVLIQQQLHAATVSSLRSRSAGAGAPAYYDFNVLTHAKYVEKLKYIHRNPVERNLVEKPEDWPWSSFRPYATGEIGRVEIESEWTWNRRERATSPPIAIEP
jgi:putative transposase